MDSAVAVALITSVTTLVLGLYNARNKATHQDVRSSEDRMRGKVSVLAASLKTCERKLLACVRERTALLRERR